MKPIFPVEIESEDIGPIAFTTLRPLRGQ